MSLAHSPARGGVRILRQRQVLELLGISSSTLWEWVRQNKFPKPFALGPNSRAWLGDEIDAYLLARAKERDQIAAADAE
jgi:prophage regulatory protein